MSDSKKSIRLGVVPRTLIEAIDLAASHSGISREAWILRALEDAARVDNGRWDAQERAWRERSQQGGA